MLKKLLNLTTLSFNQLNNFMLKKMLNLTTFGFNYLLFIYYLLSIVYKNDKI